MLEVFAKYLAVFASSMFKFVLGPVLGTIGKLSIVEIAFFTMLGMMTTVVIITFLGEKVRKIVLARFYKDRKLFSSKTRKRVRFWRNYGLKGVAFLTPVIFSPIVGTILASSFGESKKRIVIYMFASSVFWAIILSVIFHEAAQFGPVSRLLDKWS